MINVVYVRSLMERDGLTQKALAVDMHLTESCVSRMLSGKRSGSLEVLEGLARAFPQEDLRNFLVMENNNDPSQKTDDAD